MSRTETTPPFMNSHRGALLFFGWILSLHAAAGEPPPTPVTHTYKTVGTLEIKADVYRPDVSSAQHPVVVYIHGGSLINGGRAKLEKPPRMLDRYVAAGFIAVSIDYRLAPETKLPQIVADIEDAFRWVREKGPGLFGADPQRIAAAGASAGGYLALVAGVRVRPRPFAIVAESSYGDLVGAWQQKVSTSPKHQRPELTEAEAWRQVSGPPIANAADRAGDGGAFNAYLRTHGQWPKAITGWDPKIEIENYFPYLPARNVSRDYPPTMLIHGQNDSDVPVELPKAMTEEFKRHGVEHQLIIIPGGEHGYAGADPALIEAAQQKAVAFLRAHLLR
ncbi:MAG: alpha/beta hydrolase [Opitutus sp.]|nr:alpha/beta hydrolase [Opitutus sp.]